MELILETWIEGEFNGWDGEAVYTLVTGSAWQLTRYRYAYRDKCRPKAKLWKDGPKHLLEIEGMGEPLEVGRVN